jgi:hypothetical protein
MKSDINNHTLIRVYKRTGIFLAGIVFFLLLAPPVLSQPHKSFYRADREMVLEGTLQHVNAEQRYRGRSRFLIIKIRDKTTQDIYNVELCPEWFLDWDLQPGEPVKITGSLTRRRDDSRHVIARLINYKDRTRELRDKYGFPNWRGGRRRR